TSKQMPGYQTLIIDVRKTNFQSQLNVISTFTVYEKPTRLNQSKMTFYALEIYALEKINFFFRYTDNMTGAVIHSAIASYTWYNASNPSIDGYGDLNEIGDYYVLDFKTENRLVGVYIFGITIKQVNYTQPSMILYLTIKPRPATLEVPSTLVEIERKNNLPISFNLTDTRLSSPLDNFTVLCRIYKGTQFITLLEVTTSINGDYAMILPFSSLGIGAYRIIFEIIHPNYSVQVPDIQVQVTYIKILGFLSEPIFYTLLVAIIGFIVAVSLYVGVKRARIPFVIKKIDETTKIINKEKAEAPVPVMKSKNDLYSKFFREDWNNLGLTPPTIIKLKGLEMFMGLLEASKVRLSSSDAEKLILTLRELPKDEALNKLRGMGIPPDTCEQLLNIAEVNQNLEA
ncbi:MAG TPA: hypothetical protein VMV49_12000, partial [Candidatus Deferrimicrobium sp.]|nr:hypothetical protein [Candidatus Deferrimicrobium sp.]